MNRYFVSEIYNHARFAAGALREDIETVLKSEGFQTIELPESNNLINKIINYARLKSIVNDLKKPGAIFFHFPLRSRIIRTFYKIAQRKRIKTILYVHDLEGLRDKDTYLLKNEMQVLERSDIIIAQNERMKEVILSQLGNKKIVVLEMYDYLGINITPPKRLLSETVSFAGNLNKAPFIQKLTNLSYLKFIIYGQGNEEFAGENITFKGKVDPRILPSIIEGSFGLVWDGNSLETGKNSGEYLCYNIPHKLALYIISGLPPIVWAESAMADWVGKNNIGLVINSLFDLKQKISSVSEKEYIDFQRNMQDLREKMSQGYYLKKAIKNCLEKVN